jgi:hypothetical protein
MNQPKNILPTHTETMILPKTTLSTTLETPNHPKTKLPTPLGRTKNDSKIINTGLRGD